MPRFYQPDLTTNVDSPFVRDGNNKLVRRSYWLDMDDRTLVMVMTKGIGENLTNDEKRAHVIDMRREHLIDQVYAGQSPAISQKIMEFRRMLQAVSYEVRIDLVVS